MNEQFYIWSLEHDAWWRPKWQGYTKLHSEAGKYSAEEAYKIMQQANELRQGLTPNEAMIPVSVYLVNRKQS